MHMFYCVGLVPKAAMAVPIGKAWFMICSCGRFCSENAC